MRTAGRQLWASLGVRLAVVGALALLSLGLAADSPASLSEEPWALRQPDQQVVGVVLLVALGLGVALLVLGLLDRSSAEPLSPRRPRWPGALFLLLVVVLLGAGRALLDDDDPTEVAAPEPAPLTTPPALPGDGAGSEGGSPLLVLGLLSLVVAVTVLAGRRRPVVAPEPVEDAPDALGVGLVAAAVSLRDSEGDEPRDRVIAAYAAFEDALVSAGAPRSPGSTPARLLTDAVERGTPAGPAGVLTELFTRARYSDSRVTARDVTAAERALDALLARR